MAGRFFYLYAKNIEFSCNPKNKIYTSLYGKNKINKEIKIYIFVFQYSV